MANEFSKCLTLSKLEGMKTYTSTNSAADESIFWGRALIFNGLLMVALPLLASEGNTLMVPFVCTGCLMLLAGVALCTSFQDVNISEVNHQSQTSA
jgi:hypothetical protein